MKENGKIWLFIANQTSDGEVFDTITKAFANKEDAVEYLHDFVHGDEGEYDHAVGLDWTIESDTAEEFCAFEKMNYVNNYTEAYVVETELWVKEEKKDEKQEKYICPECGHEFVQGEYNYNYDTAKLDFECPECGWRGTESELKDDEEDFEDVVMDICLNKDICDCENLLKERFGSCKFCDEKIDDGLDDGSYLMLRSYDVDGHYVRLYYVKDTMVVTDVMCD